MRLILMGCGEPKRVDGSERKADSASQVFMRGIFQTGAQGKQFRFKNCPRGRLAQEIGAADWQALGDQERQHPWPARTARKGLPGKDGQETRRQL
ncbi:hypothetical protein ASG39_03490 [Rhizobium sp. Leaf371]|nr:hypothetical protein ASG39_03490 [Rhizobium sp. Leaf371]